MGGAARAKPRISDAWEPTWPADDLSRGAFRRRIRRYTEDLRTDQGYAFLIFRSSDNALLGGLTLANIRRGVAQAGSLGYWMGQTFARQGYMTAAVRAVIPFAFGTLRLHRLEAACIPTNNGSIRLLENTGFVREGYAPGISLYQRHLAGPPALRPIEGFETLSAQTPAEAAAKVLSKVWPQKSWPQSERSLGEIGLSRGGRRLGMATVRLI